MDSRLRENDGDGKMQLIKLTDKKILNDFVATNGGDFLQSWEWGEFQQAVGFEVLRLGIVGTCHGMSGASDQLLAIVVMVKKSLPLNFAYWFAPRGPVFSFEMRVASCEQVFDFLQTELKAKAKLERVAFLRFEPPITSDQAEYKFWQELVDNN